MTVAWEWKHLSRAAQERATRINSLLEVGIDRNAVAIGSPQTLAIKLDGLSAEDIVEKIRKPETLHNEPLVRAIVDAKLGAAHAPSDPLGSCYPNVLALTTIEPQRAIEALMRTPGVASVLAA